MDIKNIKTIVAFVSVKALANNSQARKTWADAASFKINGWLIIASESHRITALKGIDLVHFAPEGSDFNNPVILDDSMLAEVFNFAKDWCYANDIIH